MKTTMKQRIKNTASYIKENKVEIALVAVGSAALAALWYKAGYEAGGYTATKGSFMLAHFCPESFIKAADKYVESLDLTDEKKAEMAASIKEAFEKIAPELETVADKVEEATA